ncbi:hypothetical protein L6164_017992 [Bauhinia variegata]|uniref:Uncharacterized protein n=1 Tax=Bauhinia variegata TaxID=167791 RepID=A0ACB9ND83_BAUVA|nr:hypothetical protein L6164_017992 [Bauhinia variegata]
MKGPERGIEGGPQRGMELARSVVGCELRKYLYKENRTELKFYSFLLLQVEFLFLIPILEGLKKRKINSSAFPAL